LSASSSGADKMMISWVLSFCTEPKYQTELLIVWQG
jgi:hypothetical protein